MERRRHGFQRFNYRFRLNQPNLRISVSPKVDFTRPAYKEFNRLKLKDGVAWCWAVGVRGQCEGQRKSDDRVKEKETELRKIMKRRTSFTVKVVPVICQMHTKCQGPRQPSCIGGTIIYFNIIMREALTKKQINKKHVVLALVDPRFLPRQASLAMHLSALPLDPAPAAAW